MGRISDMKYSELVNKHMDRHNREPTGEQRQFFRELADDWEMQMKMDAEIDARSRDEEREETENEDE